MASQQLKIAVFGLGSGILSEQNKTDAFHAGKLIAENGHYLITGLAKGVTEYAAKGAKSVNGTVIGINPYSDAKPGFDDVGFSDTDIIIHTGMQDRGRNVISVRTCDAMIIINGNFGVLNEITNGVGENKPIIVLKHSGGVSEIIEMIFKTLKPEYAKFRMIDDIQDAIGEIEKMLS
jgi:uncharacterized protein (TIGR00725 family)